MAKSQETFNKKEKEKKRLQKRKEKEQRKEDRKANAKEVGSWEDMMAYVDENGNISSAPPDPLKKRNIKKEDIVIGTQRQDPSLQVSSVRKGKVTFFNTSKGFGFIKDSENGESIFVHSNGLMTPIKENDSVTFETERGFKGLNAVRVKTV
jgi:cold shock CspA family protein